MKRLKTADKINADASLPSFVYFTAIAVPFEKLTLQRFGALIYFCHCGHYKPNSFAVGVFAFYMCR
jgi:hypothetical protein